MISWLLSLLMSLSAPAVEPAAADAGCRVLAELDDRRAVAFAQARPARLARVYVPGSPLRRADARTIEAYAERGMRLRGTRLERLRCETTRRGPDVLLVEVVDRLAATSATTDGIVWDLPRDAPTARLVTLRRTTGGWRVAAVR